MKYILSIFTIVTIIASSQAYSATCSGNCSPFSQFKENNSYTVIARKRSGGSRYKVSRSYTKSKSYSKYIPAPSNVRTYQPVQQPIQKQDQSKKQSSDNNKNDILAAQIWLNTLGYPVGKPDGILGKKTRSQITAYQRDRKLPVTGTVTPALSADLIKQVGSRALSN